MNHTPGQWTADVFSVYVVENDWAIVAHCYGNNGEERKANARLIASAPELYEALVSAVAYFEADYDKPDWHEAAVDAIAKANDCAI